MRQPLTNQPDRPRHPLIVLQVVLIGLLVISLTLGALLEGEDSASPTEATTFTPTVMAATATKAVTETSSPATPTLEPTSTTPATFTASPSATATPEREPIARSGAGDSVFYPQKWVGPALVSIGYDGAGPLTVWTQNDNAQREDMLVNVAGAYHGNSVIDLLGTQRILRFEVRTAGQWNIVVLPLSSAMHLTIPGSIQGAGDDIVVLDGPFAPDLLTVDASTSIGDLSVFAYGEQRDQVIGAVAPYAGTVSIRRDTSVLAVKARGPWRLEITTR